MSITQLDKTTKKVVLDMLLDGIPNTTRVMIDKSDNASFLRSNIKKRNIDKYPYITLNHRLIHCFVIDIDLDNCFYNFDYAGAPPPNLIIKNHHNGHCQYIYLLDKKVWKNYRLSGAKTPEYIKLMQLVEALTNQVGGDTSFTHCLSKNPFYHLNSSDCGVYEVGRADAYSLDELEEYIDKPNQAVIKLKIKPKAPAKTVKNPEQIQGFKGRNDYLFETYRHLAYKQARQMGGKFIENNTLLMQMLNANAKFATPLHDNEVKKIANSIIKFCIENIASDAPSSAFSASQRKRIYIRWGDNTKARREARRLFKSGMKKNDIAKRLGISRPTLDRYLKSAKKRQNKQPLNAVKTADYRKKM